MLFQGEEWGASSPFLYFTDHDDPEIAEAVRTGRRREFAAFDWEPSDIPDPQAPETAARSRLDWDERKRPEHQEVEAWHRTLLALRRQLLRELVRDDDRVHSRVVDRAVVLRRGAWVVVANFADEPVSVDAAEGVERAIAVPTEGRDGPDTEVATVLAHHGDCQVAGRLVHLEAHATAVVRLERTAADQGC
jgi:maltooligosyltrehalose trehalohydrolase